MKDTKSFAIELIHLLGIVANDFTVKGVTNKLEDFMKAQELSYTNDVNINLKEIGTLEEREITVAEAVNRLIDEINRDKGLYVAYHANIAMAFKDEYKNYQGILKDSISPGVISSIANNAATTFLQMWTDHTHKPIIGHTEEELIEIHQAWYKKGYEDAQAEDYNSPSRKLIALQSLIGMEAYNLLDSISKPGFNSEVSIALSTFFKRFPEFPKDAENIPPFPAGGLSPQSDFKLYQQKGKEQAADQIIENVCCFLDMLKMKVNTKSSSKDTYQAFHDQYTLNDADIREIVSQVDILSGYLKQYSKIETNFKLFGGFVQPEIATLEEMLLMAEKIIKVVFNVHTSKSYNSRVRKMRKKADLFNEKLYDYFSTPKVNGFGRVLLEHPNTQNYPYPDSALNEIKRLYTDEQYIEMMSKADNYQNLCRLGYDIIKELCDDNGFTPVPRVYNPDFKIMVTKFKEWFEQYNAIGASSAKIEQNQVNDKRIQSLIDQVNVQKRDGNWNYSPYMLGMANGLICALSNFTNEAPEYMTAPDEYLDPSIKDYATARGIIEEWKIKYEHLNNELVLFSKKNTELENQLIQANNIIDLSKHLIFTLGVTTQKVSEDKEVITRISAGVGHYSTSEWLRDYRAVKLMFESYANLTVYGIKDINNTESSEKEAFNKKLPRAHGKTPGFIEFLDLWAHNELKAVSWERFSLSVSPTALNEAYTKAVKAYRLLVEDENKPKNVFVHPKLAQNNAAGKVHTKALQDEGYTNAHSVAYDTNSGLRVLRYTANNLTHLSVTHPDRLPTLQEMQWLRDELCREVKQMAWVIKYSDRPIGENGNYTIALIELIYV